ncbi:thioredoxin domain-containing protein [Lentibacter algarum]|uniref:thioredoxin domain-containing protein n=1 Tax=Lentibacter algarum TaxID=576131 RepID=UPI001C07ADAB|nr:thioredoxin domain-containing protein [Lentibacter algarum]MBU2980418.1 thioredoxin domain-containing protein [Lentibacter algarum]
MNRNSIIALIVLVAALGIGAYMYLGAGEEAAQGAPSEETSAAALLDVPEMTLGDADAPVKVIEYASFTCPHCGAFHEDSFDKLKADYIDTGKVQFTFREVYFDRFGLWASMIARCGGEEKFYGLTGLIMKGQQDWLGDGDPNNISAALRKIALVAGLTEEQTDACLNDDLQAQSLLFWFQENADVHAIRSTPSFVVGDELIAGNNYAKVKAAIDAQLGE